MSHYEFLLFDYDEGLGSATTLVSLERLDQ